MLKNGPFGFVTPFWGAMLEIDCPKVKKLPSGFLMPAVLLTSKTVPDPPWALDPGIRMVAFVYPKS